VDPLALKTKIRARQQADGAQSHCPPDANPGL
jgi:hypothetical protein